MSVGRLPMCKDVSVPCEPTESLSNRPGFPLARGNERASRASTWTKYALPTGALQQRRYPAHRDAAVFPARTIRLHFQVLLAITLRHQILRRNLILASQNVGDRFRASIGQRQVILIRADRVGVALDQEH